MGLKKKKNVIILTLCMVACFILYQLYFFLTITSEAGIGNKNIQVLDHNSIKDLVHVRSENDRYINEDGFIRGVFYLNIKEYRPTSNGEFKCKNSEQRIPYEQVNDDYCDCDDGTDEPSTSACPNGVYYCYTQTQKRKQSINSVPSGKVNDGICDCCDGSDEWLYQNKKSVLSQMSKDTNRRHFSEFCPNICM